MGTDNEKRMMTCVAGDRTESRAMLVLATMVAVGAGIPACDERTPLLEPDLAGGEAADAAAGLPAEPSGTPVAAAEIRQGLMARWNAAATAAGAKLDFRWATFDQFPHPTYKAGSPEAYQAFAAVLLAFFQQGDNFDFLARNHLFTIHIVHVFPSGAVGLDTTFLALATSFAMPDGYGDIPADTREALQGFANRMQPTQWVGAVDQHPVGDASTPDTEYATMCRHYCEALHETNIYACVRAGADAAACTANAPSESDCYHLRCAPMLVPASLCFTQCDSLRAAYDAVCASAPAPAGLCPTAPADHDRVCRDGCSTSVDA